jgi:DNA-binding transcriptional regulator YbjK
MKNLEDSIRERRKDLDVYDPPAGMWDRINKDLNRNKITRFRWMQVAAVAIVLTGAAFLLMRYQGLPGKNTSAVEKMHPLLRESEIYYSNLMDALYREAEPMLVANPEIESEFHADISQLDSICAVLKKDLRDNVDNQDVVEALIRNYRIRINILEEMLSYLKESETDNVNSDGNEL